MWKCKLGFHKWGKYGGIIRETWIHNIYGYCMEGSEFYRDKQTKTCERCGLKKDKYL